MQGVVSENAEPENYVEQFLKAELFSASQMQQHGLELARQHVLSHKSGNDRLLGRLSDNEAILRQSVQDLRSSIQNNHRIPPAGEWLLDNYFLVEEQIRIAKRHLPRGYSRSLPLLLGGPSNDLPRVYDIAMETIAHNDGKLDVYSLSGLVTAYQTIAPLNLGELWAIPIMIRLSLIENLRRVAAFISSAGRDRAKAIGWAEQMIETTEKDPTSLILVVADMARSKPPRVSAFVTELTRRLQGQGPGLTLPLSWVDQWLSEVGMTREQMMHAETQQQAQNQVSIANTISSMRALAAVDWSDFVETHSIVEATLLKDPADVYGSMDFATRDHYRHVIEKMATRTHLSEVEVARLAVQLAAEGRKTDEGEVSLERTLHVGYYLVSRGFQMLERAAQVRVSAWDIIRRAAKRYPLFAYLGAIWIFTGFVSVYLWTAGFLPVKVPFTLGVDDPVWHNVLLGLLAIVILIATSQLAVSLTNWVSTIFAKAYPLPKLDFAKGIPSTATTLVVVPTMLTSQAGVDEMVEALEVRYLANKDEQVYFALLTDFTDAPQEHMPLDEILTDRLKSGIEELNRKYCAERNDTFFALHRPRLFNAQEGVWMGFERKRGKLNALNDLLQHDKPDAFSLIAGDIAAIGAVKYIITLDADTQLPREAARKFVGAMSHPLNRPRYDKQKKMVVDGYGILQPRVDISLSPLHDRSDYARLCAHSVGIDPYTRTVSDVYQDLFHEGSFIGKGIYELEAFSLTLDGRFPDNQILSHDLVEGCYARSGLLSDGQLYETFPGSYTVDAARRHRWIRGDWQILGWLLPFTKDASGQSKANELSLLSRWKIFDNLRRSLVPMSQLVLFVLSWTWLSEALFWTASMAALIYLPGIMFFLSDVLRKPSEMPLSQHLKNAFVSFRQSLSLTTFHLSCVPYEALSNSDAILRTLYRMFVSHKHLLEWRTASSVKASPYMSAFWRSMWFGPLVGLVLAAYLGWARPGVLVFAAPVLALWIFSPCFAWALSRPKDQKIATLTSKQTRFLGATARRTWQFFLHLAGPEDNFLPPDNYQIEPVERIAHRTSPTNIGMALLANLSAFDFGYLTITELVSRTHATLSTMTRMERFRGHFYNWYDTVTLLPLVPKYVSAVDSGNLAGHLLVLRQGLIALADQPIIAPRLIDGLGDTLAVLEDTLKSPLSSVNHFKDALELARTELSGKPDLSTVKRLLQLLAQLALDIQTGAQNFDEESQHWSRELSSQATSALSDLEVLTPWILLDEISNQDEAAGEICAYPGMTPLLKIPSLRDLALMSAGFKRSIEDGQFAQNVKAETMPHVSELVEQASGRARQLIATIDSLSNTALSLSQMQYDFLYDKGRQLLAIGYNVDDHRLDASFYDLLASECRLGCYTAISQGQLPQDSWFALGRLLSNQGGEPVLYSWSGSMFEYLMPLLVMPTYEDTLLDRTCRAAVDKQIEYGKQRGVPWGISESGYNSTDTHLNYQYRAFGVPGLGLKRGLIEDVVIAPYATVMALMVNPEAAYDNLQILADEGFYGRYGFYEAVDYTPSRLARGQKFAVIRSFMAHHEGMSLLSLAYLLLDRPMQRRFIADPGFLASDLLLQERVPKTMPVHSITSEIADLPTVYAQPGSSVRVITSPDNQSPDLQLLSNGRYHVMITASGGSYSRWRDLALTRFREDSTRDNWGTFCYVRDRETGDFFSNTYQPTLEVPESFECVFSESKAEFRRRDGDFDIFTEVVVSPEDDIEMRRIKITNRSNRRRSMDVTSYAEVVMASPIADMMHTAFSNLFVQTELLKEQGAILCHRRARSQGENNPWMFHMMAVHGATIEDLSYETDRARFVGRGNTPRDPSAMRKLAALSNSEGSVLDPIVAICHRLTLEPEESVTINIVTGIHESREGCTALVAKYKDKSLSERVFELAYTHSQVGLRHLNATDIDAQLFNTLASALIYPNKAFRAEPGIIAKNTRGQSSLWGYSISGDFPIVLLQIKDMAMLDLVRQVIQAHAYWRLKGLICDLVIWNEDQGGYRQALQDQVLGLISSGLEAHMLDGNGGIFVRAAEQISPEDRILFQSVARLVISDDRGSLAEQTSNRPMRERRPPRLTPLHSFRPGMPKLTAPRTDLMLDNGLGGFTRDGREYIITTSAETTTPAPWSNVIANPFFGTIVSESGIVYTWGENAHEYRLTPWHNDPVSDTTGEAFYVRDEESGYYWSPTPLPKPGSGVYTTRHGFGYSVFEHEEFGIKTELTIFVSPDASVKHSVIKVKNNSGRKRIFSVTGYVDLILGDLKQKTSMHIVTEIDLKTGCLVARNTYNYDFPGRVVFFDVNNAKSTFTADRSEFIGRNGSLEKPSALDFKRLSGRVGAGLDPCAAIQVPVELEDGEEREISFRLGQGRDIADARILINRYRDVKERRSANDLVHGFWRDVLNVVQVNTPDQSLNMLANGWLLYQVLSCRLFGRSGYYQSGGAYGFRDQLQDCMSLVHSRPSLLREQILRSASRQFSEGDVQHWWHPPGNRGVRTQCSDDFLWLPLATSRYVKATGDTGILDESLFFITGRQVNDEEDSYYDQPGQSNESATLYEHCVRAIKHGLRFGVNGLPLMGCGDWNDGMNLVGVKGKGESVWLAFFTYQVLDHFEEVANLREDLETAALCRENKEKLKVNVEANAWDGEWYRRAYFDDGTPLGSAQNEECQIDSISQSWSVLSGAGEKERTVQAMKSLNQRLVRRDFNLIQLLDPPFDKSKMDPGYIKGYVPGVRENGGQYTHSAVWAAMAFAEMGDNKNAWELVTMINPVNHTNTKERLNTYKAEPYVLAADVYAVSPHTGRGGWTWYTGSAAWLYRLIVESLLGLRIEVDKLYIEPCLPDNWTGYTFTYRYRNTHYEVKVETRSELDVKAGMPTSISKDNGEPKGYLELVDDGQMHRVVARI
ncbi:MAG: cyclic beta,2-glucan synthetase [Cyanobacteriota bacterium erpe_2018_sw_39hr_WHONDRS-SW48-000098_B_bin.30]|nr:cyclic beta,2-glucan synthetase [Cyanobacteriota bacterium erpe_2018_sw_39hr_WHONDRS-SW48-000098_B_bin.30]